MSDQSIHYFWGAEDKHIETRPPLVPLLLYGCINSSHRFLFRSRSKQAFHIKCLNGWKTFIGSFNLLLIQAGFLTHRSQKVSTK